MRISLGCFVLGLGCLAWMAAVPAVGQSDLPRVAGGVFGSVGIEGIPELTASGGAYAEAARFRFRPGVEVRATGGDLEGRLVLAGPRVAHSFFGRDVGDGIWRGEEFGAVCALAGGGSECGVLQRSVGRAVVGGVDGDCAALSLRAGITADSLLGRR